jgi:hypothetical protein
LETQCLKSHVPKQRHLNLYIPTLQTTQPISTQQKSVSAVRETAIVYQGNHTKYTALIHKQIAEFQRVEE